MKEHDHKVLMSSNKSDWETPQNLFDEMNNFFGFTLDAAASPENAKCPNYFTERDNGLEKSWEGEIVFCNPPYGAYRTPLWVEKAYNESFKDELNKILLIAARVDTKMWADYISKASTIYFIKGRLKFSDSKDSAPFPSAIIVFNGGRKNEREVLWTNRDFTEFW